ncbi:hypothetical protein HF086_007647 [Spodoptera exigua]|uniref:Uncharacterized protein n=1 Tax=Spodoptera exigua TaxID=7107 RepID=A0A922MAV5_SPOEX|nr:hypothetical protein HF086_007647 [Spodoptera exigua]
MATEEAKPITLKKLPLILNRKIIIRKGIKPLSQNVRVLKSLQNSIKEIVIYKSKDGDFMSGEARTMTIVNRLNMLTKACRTIARCESYIGQTYEKTSDEITKLIGQKNYDFLFTSLCSIINQELKVRSIYSLLTVAKSTNFAACQTEFNDVNFNVNKKTLDAILQTNESCLKSSIRKGRRRQKLAPVVVKDTPNEVKKPRRIVINPDKFSEFQKDNNETVSSPEASSLPELSSVFDEDSNSNNSVGRFSSLSIKTTSDLMDNPLNIISNVDRHTRDIKSESGPFSVTEPSRGLNVESPKSHADGQLGLNLKEMLRHVPPEQRIKLLLRQGLTEWKNCLTMDQEGHFPIHVAVLTNDVDLLRRQCLALKMRESTVDLLADGMTPLRMALYQENPELTSILLDAGADPFDTDDENRSLFHVAADLDAEHLPVLLNHFDHYKRTIEILVENGADPTIVNFAGSNINELLTEFSIPELSMLIANKLTSVRYFDNALPYGSKGSDFMLFKNDKGEVNIKELNEKKTVHPPVSENVTVKKSVVWTTFNNVFLKVGTKAELAKMEEKFATSNSNAIAEESKTDEPIITTEETGGEKRKCNAVAPLIIKRIKKQ